jgi:hypothetical protein
MQKKILLCLFILTNWSLLTAQVGINTTSPSDAAVLDINSSADGINYGGLLIPRVDLTQRAAIAAGAADDGLMIYLIDGGTRCVQIWDGVNSVWDDVYCMPIIAADPWINEFHYDNNGADTNEAVEIAGEAGFDLSGWSVLLYNGSGGIVYATISLSGTIPDEGSGYGTLAFTSTLQNGPDGFALVNPSGTVIQFLSYEGSFTATDGAASGMTSVDVGVAESDSTAATESLQLRGTGSQYSDFTWSSPASSTFGSINTSQTIN